MSVSVEQVTIKGDTRFVAGADRYGNILINTKQLFAMPHFAGAVDVVRMLQFSPGVVASNDADASIHVRGSDSGQHITLLNNAPVYSPAHLFNFFSVFNTAHLGGATFIKSNMPVQYGSALSSVLDIRTHSYVPSKFGAEGNIGLIESDLALQIPLSRKSALYLSGRHSYISWLTTMLNRIEMDISYEFQDYGLTYVHDLGKVGKLVVNSHFNHDGAKANLGLYDSTANIQWWDSTSSAILSTPIAKDVSMENTIYGTVFRNKFAVGLIGNKFSVPTHLTDIGVRNCTKWQRDKFELLGGFDYAYRRIQPQSVLSTIATNKLHDSSLIQNTHEAAIFVSAIYKPIRHLEVDAGVRMSLYSIGGKEFYNPEPRIMVSVPFGNSARIWASYNKTAQYLQLVPQSNVSFATDFYTGSSDKHPPQISYCTNLGYSQSASIFNHTLHWSVELFYRQMYNVLEFDARLNTMLAHDYDFEDYLYSGIGEAYGAEFMLSYSHPKFDIQAFYTLSRSLRRFNELNRGKAFASYSDRPHNLSLVVTYRPTKQWSLSSTFVYGTGAPYTAPTAIQMIGGAFLKEYGAYNGSRLPDYHRLDISATYWFKSKRFQRNGINISIFNVYLRRNPMLLSWKIEEDEDTKGLYHIIEGSPALFEILPSISWTFKF